MAENGFIARIRARFGGSGRRNTDGGSRAPALGGWLRWSPALSVVSVLIYAFANDSNESPWGQVLAVGLSVGAAASAVGAIVGFLFGLPRTVDLPLSTTAPTPVRAGLATNTNLEEISDWLTKILVGIGLVQLGAFVSRLSELGDSLAPGLGGGDGADAFAVGLVVYSLIDGFLLGYLWTRIVVSLRLRDAQRLMQATDEVLSAPLPPSPPRELPPAPPGGAPPAPPAEPQRQPGGEGDDGSPPPEEPQQPPAGPGPRPGAAAPGPDKGEAPPGSRVDDSDRETAVDEAAPADDDAAMTPGDDAEQPSRGRGEPPSDRAPDRQDDG